MEAIKNRGTVELGSWRAALVSLLPLWLLSFAMMLANLSETHLPIELAGFSLESAQLSEIYRSLILLLGALWLLMIGWTVIRLYNPLLQEGPA